RTIAVARTILSVSTLHSTTGDTSREQDDGHLAMAYTFEFKQKSHLHPELLEPAWRTLNAGKLTGRWLNTDPETQGLAELVITQTGDQFRVGAAGAGAGSPIQWPMTNARALANLEEEAGQRAVALAVTFDFGYMKA